MIIVIKIIKLKDIILFLMIICLNATLIFRMLASHWQSYKVKVYVDCNKDIIPYLEDVHFKWIFYQSMAMVGMQLTCVLN